MLSKVSVAEFIDLAICTPARKAMLAVGEFGIGKTQVIRQIGEKLGIFDFPRGVKLTGTGFPTIEWSERWL